MVRTTYLGACGGKLDGGVCSDGCCNLIGQRIFEQMDHTLFRECSRLQVS